MDIRSSEATRLLAAAAISGGGMYRRKVLEYFDQRYRAMGPERGYDPEFVARVAAHFQSRRLGLGLLHVALLVTIVLAVLFSEEGENLVAILVAAGALFALWIVSLTGRLRQRSILRKHFSKAHFDPDEVARKFPGALSGDQEQSLRATDPRIVLHDRFDPFLGSGVNVGGWSFALDLTEASEPSVTPSMPTLSEVYQTVSRALAELELPSLSDRPILVGTGEGIDQFEWILPDPLSRPRTRADAVATDSWMTARDGALRYYRCVEVRDWGNELILTYFLRFTRRGKKLFCEVTAYLLTPIDHGYRAVDRTGPMRPRIFFGEALLSVLAAPFEALYSVVLLLEAIATTVNEAFVPKFKIERQAIEDDPSYNRGAKGTLRENLASKEFQRYFQILDQQMYTKMIDQSILDGLVTCFEAHGIDTSGLRERTSTIINSGIIVHGGDVSAQSLAVGDAAKARTKIVNPIRKAAKGSAA